MTYTFHRAICGDGLPLIVSPYVPNQRVLQLLALELELLENHVRGMDPPPFYAKAIERLLWEVETLREIVGDVEWTPDPSVYEYWERPDTKGRFAVRMFAGRITGVIDVRDPIDHSPLYAGNLSVYRYDYPEGQKLIDWAEKHRGEFAVVPDTEIILDGDYDWDETTEPISATCNDGEKEADWQDRLLAEVAALTVAA